MEQLKAFTEKAMSDEGLMEKLDILGKADAPDEEIIALAAQHGFTITKEEIEAMKSQSFSRCKNCNIGEEDLVNITGGTYKTENRWDPVACPKLTRTRYECVGFLMQTFCDHYRLISPSGNRHHSGDYVSDGAFTSNNWIHECDMGAFKYKGTHKGTPQ